MSETVFTAATSDIDMANLGTSITASQILEGEPRFRKNQRKHTRIAGLAEYLVWYNNPKCTNPGRLK